MQEGMCLGICLWMGEKLMSKNRMKFPGKSVKRQGWRRRQTMWGLTIKNVKFKG